MKYIIKQIIVVLSFLCIHQTTKTQVIDTIAFFDRLSEAHKESYIGYPFSNVLDSLDGLHIDYFDISSPWRAVDSVDYVFLYCDAYTRGASPLSVVVHFKPPLPYEYSIWQWADSMAIDPLWNSNIANYLKDFIVDYIYVRGNPSDPEEVDLPHIRNKPLTGLDWRVRNMEGCIASKKTIYEGQPFSVLWSAIPAGFKPQSVWGIGVPGVAREWVTRFFFVPKDSLNSNYIDVKWQESPLKSVTQQYEASTVRAFQYPRDYNIYKDMIVDSVAVHYTDSVPMPKKEL